MNYNGIVTYQNFDARIFTEKSEVNADLSDAINHLAVRYVEAVTKDFTMAHIDAVLHTAGSGAVWWETPNGDQLQWPDHCPNFWAWWESSQAQGLTVED